MKAVISINQDYADPKMIRIAENLLKGFSDVAGLIQQQSDGAQTLLSAPISPKQKPYFQRASDEINRLFCDNKMDIQLV
jgi:hypothetical protein